jgi:hypothetical protein
MNVVSLLVAHAQTPPLEQPLEASFHDVSERAQPTAVLLVPVANRGCDPPSPQRFADPIFSVIRSVCQHFVGTAPATAIGLCDRWNSIDKGDRAQRVGHIRTRVLNRERNAVGIGDQMTLRAALAAICRVWAGFLPPKSARTEQLSMTAQDKSTSPAAPSSLRKTFQIFPQTPASCQSRSRRQHVMPQPQPISRGRYSQGQPLLRMKRIPVRHARSETRGRPPFGFGGSGGKKGRTFSHNSSDNNCLAMWSSLTQVPRPKMRKRISMAQTGKEGFVRVPNA